MPSWLDNTFKAVGSAVDDFADDIVEQVVDHVGDMEFGPAIDQIKEAGLSSNKLAKETTELCRSTQTKSQDMMEFCGELKETLTASTEGGVSADAFETIQELLSGDKVQTAMGLAKEMNEDAKKCVDKSVEMVRSMGCGGGNTCS
jgi:putative lipoic acid-binding regulatory protein